MASPVWKTQAGKIDIIQERVFYSFQLEAEDADSTTLNLLPQVNCEVCRLK